MPEVKLPIKVTDEGSLRVLNSVQQGLLVIEKEAQKAQRSLSTVFGNEANSAMQSYAGNAGKVGQALSALGPAGMAAAAGLGASMAAGGAVVSTLIDLSNRAIEYAGNISDLSATTGTSVEALQRMQYAGSLVGVSLEATNSAVFKMQKALENTPQAFNAIAGGAERLKALAPEKAFAEIARHVGEIANPTERSAAAIALLGKGAESVMPLLTSRFAEAQERAEALGLVMDASVIAALDRTGDAADSLQSTWEGLLRNLGSAIVTSGDTAGSIDGLTDSLGELSKLIQENRALIGVGIHAFLPIPNAQALQVLRDAIQANKSYFKGLYEDAAATMPVVKEFADLMARMNGKSAVGGGGAPVAKPQATLPVEGIGWGTGDKAYMADAQVKAKAIAKAEAEIRKEFQQSMEVQARYEKSMEDNVKRVTAELKRQYNERTTLQEMTAAKTRELTEKMANNAKVGEESNKWATELANSALPEVDRKLAEIAQRAAEMKAQIQGGVMGAEELRDKVDKVAAAAAKAAKEAAGIKGQLSAALANLPAVILGAIQGGGDVGKAVGASLGGAIGNGVSEELGKKISGTLGKALGSAIPIVGSLVGGLVGGGISKIFGGLFGDGEGKKVREMREQFLSAAGGIEELRKKAADAHVPLDKIFNSKKVKDFESAVKDVNRALDTQAQANEAVEAAMQKWGITVQEMGPKFAAQHLNEQATSLIKDWEVLRASGADMLAVTTKMAPAMTEYFNAAVAAGQGIPQSMQPALQKMVEMGLLTDAAGNKLTSLDGVNFTQSLEEGLRGTIEAINALVVALGGIPTSIPAVNIPVNYQGGGGYSGEPSQEEIARMRAGHAIGSRSLPSNGWIYAHKGEGIIPADKNNAFGRGGGELKELQGLRREIGSMIRLLPTMMKGAMATSV